MKINGLKRYLKPCVPMFLLRDISLLRGKLF